MKTKFKGILTLFFALVVQMTFAQELQTVSGVVTDGSGIPLPGVNVIIKGTDRGTQTDFNGEYYIEVEQGQTLVFSYLGMITVEYLVEDIDEIDVVLKPDAAQLDEVVVTALGIEREKKSLGYATQVVDGSEVNEVPTTNFVNSLSGKVAGLNTGASGTLGGSSNVIIRGSTSLTGNNQALFVVDGVPVSNAITNEMGQASGRGGYDYGNAAADINPSNIASINVLKGAAATALYGSRAANGVIIITTKKGEEGEDVGVSVNSSFMMTNIDDSTLPVYQDQYGAGYGPYYASDNGYFALYDLDGDGVEEMTTPFTEDASFGAPFDPSLLIYQWNSIYPQLEDTYLQATPWVAGENTPNAIWTTGFISTNSVALDGGTERSTFRMGLSNTIQQGNLPNSKIDKYDFHFNGSHDFTEDLTGRASVYFTQVNGIGRYGTGYSSNNIMQQFRQWWQINVDLFEQRDAYFATRENITWNPNSPSNLSPIYSDNPYFTLYENYSTDTRNRYFGNMSLEYDFTDDLNLLGRFTYDTYDELREERIAVGSSGVSGYSRFNNRAAEYNFDLILSYNHDFTEDLNFDGNLGLNVRRNSRNSIRAATNGGLNIPRLYTLANSASSLLAPDEFEYVQMVDGIYARAGVGYDDTWFVEGTIRRDRSSTLPIENNTFWYPSISGSALISNIIDADWMSFMKLRANYAEVGSATEPYRVFTTYGIGTPFGGAATASNPVALNNLELVPERSKAYEFGVDAGFFDNRLGFDISYYNTRTENQITPVPVSNATGFDVAWLNAGTIENKGVEVLLELVPVRSEDFTWNTTVSFAKNESTVLSLREGIENLELASLQGGITINATPGEPYGTIRGTDYIYDDQGRKVVGSNGYYLTTSDNNNIIGNNQPDWTGGISNRFEYKNVSLSFLIDAQKGGDIFSLDTWYGFATGLYDITVGENDLENPMRNFRSGGGGIVLPGVNADVTYNDDGTYTVTNATPNATRADFSTYANPYGYARDANAGHIYDASFVKLREVSLTYTFSEKVLEPVPFTNASISLIGSNLWIIHKNVPYSDPEAGLSAGNIQGYQSGAYPAVRSVGASVKLNF